MMIFLRCVAGESILCFSNKSLFVFVIKANHVAEDVAEVRRQMRMFSAELAEDTSEEPRSFVEEICLAPGYEHTLASIQLEHSLGVSNTFPLCHGDLTTTNVIVSKDGSKVVAVIDWEYAGYYPYSCQPPPGSDTGWAPRMKNPPKPSIGRQDGARPSYRDHRDGSAWGEDEDGACRAGVLGPSHT